MGDDSGIVGGAVHVGRLVYQGGEHRNGQADRNIILAGGRAALLAQQGVGRQKGHSLLVE